MAMAPIQTINKRISMIICVTTEVILSEKPAEMLNIDHVHIMNRIIRKEEDSDIYRKREDIYKLALNEVERRLNEAGITYEVHDEDTMKFEVIMPALYEIMRGETENESDVYMNISGSTPEFAAAASIVAMMFKDNCKLFSVGISKHNKDLDELKDFYTDQETQRLIGRAKDVKGPFIIHGFDIDKPDERLLQQLKIFSAIPIEKRSNSNVIRSLIYAGLWKPSKYYRNGVSYIEGTSVQYEESANNEDELKDNVAYKKKKASEAVIYQRSFINKWKEEGWIYNEPKSTGNKYELTEKAIDYLNLFCSDNIYTVNKDNLRLKD